MDFCLRLTIFSLFIHFTFGHIIVYRQNQTIEEFYDLPAQFGPSLPPNGLRVFAIESLPYKDACKTPLVPPPKPPKEISDSVSKKYVLIIARTNCTFEEKVRNAQTAGYDAAIVYNIGSDDLEQMSAKNGANIQIPSVFVGETTGNYILEGYLYDSGFSLVINDELPFNINTHLILPFSILVGFCFIIMIAYMIYKCAREQRRLRQYRLPKRLLKKIPTIKFTKGLPYETCVICIDDYVEGDKLRVLPCQHAYHCTCIDTWLTKNRRVCPICKRKVFPKGDSRRSRRRPASSDTTTDSETDDTTPLLNQNVNVTTTNTANHGTFNTAAAAASNTRSGGGDRQTSDEENVLTASNNNGRRQNAGSRTNPFDRVPNNTSTEQNVTRSIFNIFSIFRFFTRNRSSSHEEIPHGIENPINAVLESTVRSIAVNLPPRPSSNNVLNTHLSGSFHNDYDDNNDDQDNEGRTIYEPIINTSQQQQQATATTSSDSIFIQTPSRGGIGVAALPNTYFFSNNDTSVNTNARRETAPAAVASGSSLPSSSANTGRSGGGGGRRRKRNASLFIV